MIFHVVYPNGIGFLLKMFEGRFGEATHFIALYYIGVFTCIHVTFRYFYYWFALLVSVVEALADHTALPELPVPRFVEEYGGIKESIAKFLAITGSVKSVTSVVLN